jgi:hypothetical protein
MRLRELLASIVESKYCCLYLKRIARINRSAADSLILLLTHEYEVLKLRRKIQRHKTEYITKERYNLEISEKETCTFLSSSLSLSLSLFSFSIASLYKHVASYKGSCQPISFMAPVLGIKAGQERESKREAYKVRERDAAAVSLAACCSSRASFDETRSTKSAGAAFAR